VVGRCNESGGYTNNLRSDSVIKLPVSDIVGEALASNPAARTPTTAEAMLFSRVHFSNST